MSVSSTATAIRKPGFTQGLMLVLPVTLAVIGASVFTATASLMIEHFASVPNGEYLVQLLITMPALWILLFAPVAGWLADRYGRKRLLVTALVLYAVVGCLPFMLENIYVILLTRCGVGIAESVVLTVTTAMIGDYFSGRTRERWLAAQTAVATLSALAIIAVGGVLGAIFGWQGPFLVYLFSLVLAVGIAVLVWEPQHDDSAEAVARQEGEVRYHVFPMARILGICAITVLGSILFYATVTQNANALVSLGVRDPAEIGKLSSLASLGVPIGTVLFWVIGRLHVGWLLTLSLALIGIGFHQMGVATTPQAYALAANVQQIGCGLFLPTVLVWATSGLAFEIRGRGAGAWQAAFAFGQFLSGMALTFLGKQLGGLLPAFSTLGTVCLVAAAVALMARFLFGGKGAAGGARPSAGLH